MTNYRIGLALRTLPTALDVGTASTTSTTSLHNVLLGVTGIAENTKTGTDV